MKTKKVKQTDNPGLDYVGDSYGVAVTSENVGDILPEGKTGTVTEMDLSVFPTLKAKEKELKELKAQGESIMPSAVGTHKEVLEKLDQWNQGKKKLELRIGHVNAMKKLWVNKASELFAKACSANIRIVFGLKKYDILQASSGKKNRPGLYVSTEPGSGKRDTAGLPEEIVQDLTATADSAFDIWLKHLHNNQSMWFTLAKITGDKAPEPNTPIEKIISETDTQLENAEKDSERYEDYQSRLHALEKEVEALSKRVDETLALISEIDPVLTAFTLPASVGGYNAKWLEIVKKSAGTRNTMPYLPLLWENRQFGAVFNWKKAITDGKPNLFIEAATDEGSEGHTDMLDNFVATMLLAFPVKQLHFTVLQNRTINPFVKNLPEKVCRIYDAMADRENIALFVKQLKDKFSESRNNRVDDCCPKEIVVIAGFNRGDRVFTDLMSQLNEIVENGRRAGIYFAIVLSDDITEYDWKDKDANDFEQFFTPYSTILTTGKDKDGYNIPDYNLLSRDATVESEEGVKKGNLADLITDYLTKDSETINCKFCEFLENGELYNAEPIKALAEQPKSNVNQFVVPIASSDSDETVNLRLGGTQHLFCMILGASGSGKSFTLHNILSNLMLKYDPSTVDFILIDFKGVELDYYKGVPHVSKLMVNGSDPQMVKEILKSIISEMNDRRIKFRENKVVDIDSYNAAARKNGVEQMKHIIMLVDECQNLFLSKGQYDTSEEIIAIAKEGRAFGLHMVLATQTMTGFEIPKDAAKQFSDFIFMKCEEGDVSKCGIDNKELMQRVNTLTTGELFYYNNRNYDLEHGYAFDYRGPGGAFKKKTLESLRSSRFQKPSNEHFYFDASQVYHVDKAETEALLTAAKSGLRPTPMTLLGKNLSVKCDTSYTRMGRVDGANLLVLGANNLLQAERVLWNAAVSLYDCNKALDKKVRYYIVPNISDDIESGAREAHEARMDMLRTFIDRPGVTMIDESERLQIIERVAATVRLRQQLAESDRNAVNSLDEIFLVIANQDRCARLMAKKPRGLDSLDENLAAATQTTVAEAPQKSKPESTASDSLGFEGLVMPGSEPETNSAPDFMGIDFGSFDSPSATPSAPALSPGKPGRDYDEELKYALEYGPVVGVHILIQSTGPDKIYAEDAMRQKAMTMLFNDIIFLKMLQAEGMSLPVDDRDVKNLSADPGSLRAIVYNGDRGMRTIVPFDFPKLKN